MKTDKTKATIIALVALVVVCGGSFLGAKTLNKNVAVTSAPIVITTTSGVQVTENITTTGVISSITTMPVATTAKETTTEKKKTTTEKKEDETTKLNQFTTFANSSSSSTTKAQESTSVKTSVAQMTTTPATTTPTTEAEAQAVIESAAVFSEGFLGYLFNPDRDFYYTTSDPWQRQLGFNELYDVGAPFINFYYDTMRCKFNYDNKDWMIQFWKGQYGFVFIGGEIGVYNKPADREVEHYDCASDEDSLMMSMSFYRKGEELLSRDYAKYWWCTGFVPGKLDQFSDRSELTIRCRITMKDYEMLLAFCDSLKGNGLELNEDFTTSGLDVFIVW